MNNYYDNIKELILKSEIYDRVKDYAKDRNKVKVYYEIGKLLSEAGKEYGKNIIKQYYEVFSNQKLNPLGSTLNWSHYRELITIKDINAINILLNIVLMR